MKYERICTVPRGHTIPDGEDGFTVSVIAETIEDEIALKQEAILELEKEAIEGINAIIERVEIATGRRLRGVKHISATVGTKSKKFRPKLEQPCYGDLRTHIYSLGANVAKHWDFDEEDDFIDWLNPIIRDGYQS
jgi:NDP-sugar pyrophosphorylase family protein